MSADKVRAFAARGALVAISSLILVLAACGGTAGVSTPTQVTALSPSPTQAPTPTSPPMPVATPTPSPISTATPAPTIQPSPAYDGMNLAYAISAAQSAGESPYDVGGGLLGIIVASDWTVCFFAVDGSSVTFYAAKSCAPDPNSRSGAAPSAAVVGTLVGKDLQTAEATLTVHRYGYAEIGGGGLGIIDPENWTVCYAAVVAARAQLFAAKSCTSAPAGG